MKSKFVDFLKKSNLNQWRRILIKRRNSRREVALNTARVTLFGRRRLEDVRLILDVGANDGFSFLYQFAKDNSNIKFIAFEPVPELRKAILRAKAGLKNYTVEAYAIDTQNGIKKMGVSNILESGGGVSSLLEFKRGMSETRSDFYFKEIIQVETITLENYLDNAEINKVDYLHIDAQGKDLDVLKSLGKSISKIIAGVVECSVGENGALYVGQPPGKEIEKFLEENEFEIVLKEYQGTEYNAYFISKKYCGG